MPVRVMSPKQSDETEAQFAKRVEAYWKAVEQDGEKLKALREKFG